MRVFQIIALLLAIASTSVFAQFNVGFTLSNDIPVIKGTDTISMAWAGGINNPQFSSLNFSSDPGDELFMFDRDGALTKGFRYNPSTGKYQWRPYMDDDSTAFENYFPELEHAGWCLLRDYDNDGHMDIFSTYNFDQVQVHRNISNSIYPEYELKKAPIIRFNPKDCACSNATLCPSGCYNPIRLHGGGNKLPVIMDLDDDGDLDFMYFAANEPGQRTGCNTFATFRNTSKEDYGSLDSLSYVIEERCWGKITPTVGTAENNWKPYDCDTACKLGALRSERDITGTQAMHDLNGDGKLDLMITFDHNDEIYAMYNVGTNADGIIDISHNDDNFPSNDRQIELSNQPYPYFIDVDHDGDDDMLVGSNHLSNVNAWEYDTSGTIITDQFYKNNGSNNSPKFELEKIGFISGEMIDAGIRSFPAFGDLTGDGLADMVIGNSGYSVFNPDLSPAFVQYYKNLGTKDEPVFKLVNTNLGEVNLLNLYIAHPTLGDLDNDGDLDMIVGDGNGYIHVYENTGSATALYFELKNTKYKNIHLTGEAHPQLFDMNNDGMLDLIVGDGYGKIHYFENDGTDDAFDFDQNPTIAKMGGLDLYKTRGGMTCPYFTRNLDSTNLLYLFVGTENGIINGYGPIDDFGGEYTLGDSIVVEAHQTSITGLNLFGDKRDELCVGQRAGGLYLLNRTNNIPFGISAVKSKGREIMLFPNPTRDQTLIKMKASSRNGAELQVTDLQGNVISRKHIYPTNSYYNENFDLRGYPQGVYLVSVVENDTVSWAKLVLE